ncbi:MAG TPA: prenyltransferase [Anaerolineae bacterium]|nr:prenyltransferase [Anaerolineae bacterium]HOQ99787.1 prenyltransferase [Anaerolineae bacterium]HPL29800.1 prenyltransferase [Anaerolineae bacterium]
MPSFAQKVSTWLALARLPFHAVGVLPFILGNVLAWRLRGAFRWGVCAWGTAGVVLVMLATYLAGEYWDYEEDVLAAALGPSRFSGGSRMVQQGRVPRRAPLWGSLAGVLLALAVAAVLQWGYRTGPWTVPLALIGLLGGFFYSARPVRWVRLGLGELWIAFNYGWLPVAVGCYLQTGTVAPPVHRLALPIGLSIVNVILLNEFPDYPADRAAGKANLAVRLGLPRASLVYAAIAAGAWLGVALSTGQGVPRTALWLCLPSVALSLALVVQVLRGRWRDRAALDRLCGANLLVNLGTTAAYLLAFLMG